MSAPRIGRVKFKGSYATPTKLREIELTDEPAEGKQTILREMQEEWSKLSSATLRLSKGSQ